MYLREKRLPAKDGSGYYACWSYRMTVHAGMFEWTTCAKMNEDFEIQSQTKYSNESTYYKVFGACTTPDDFQGQAHLVTAGSYGVLEGGNTAGDPNATIIARSAPAAE